MHTLREWANFIGLPVKITSENVAVALSENRAVIKFVIPRDLYMETSEVPCPTCDGTGHSDEHGEYPANHYLCPTCNGDGWVEREEG